MTCPTCGRGDPPKIVVNVESLPDSRELARRIGAKMAEFHRSRPWWVRLALWTERRGRMKR